MKYKRYVYCTMYSIVLTHHNDIETQTISILYGRIYAWRLHILNTQ